MMVRMDFKAHSVSVLYRGKGKVTIKNSSMESLWFRVAHLTDSPFEAVNDSQGCDGYWETFSLNDSMRIK